MRQAIRWDRWKLLATVVLALGGTWCPAGAQFFQGFEAQLGTEIPRSIQVRGKVNFPENWFGIVGVGYSPRFLTDAYGSVATELSIHGDKTAKLVGAALGNTFSLDVRVGYEFGGNENGVYVDFGYGLFAGKGSDTDMDTLEGALNEDFFGVAQTVIPRVSSTVHNLVAHLGYTHRLSNSFILAIEGGLVKAISSSNSTTFASGVTTYAQDTIDAEVDKYLSGVYQDEMIIPTFSLWLSYLF